MHTGQHIRTDAGSSWFFDAGRIALDFAHTGGFADDPTERRPRSQLGELLASPADLDEWLSEHTEPIDVGASARELQDARALRAAIARLAVAAAPAPASTAAERTAVAAGLRAGAGRTRPAPDDIDTVNLFAALPDVPPSLPGGRARRRRALHRGRLRRRRGRRPADAPEPVLGRGLRPGVLRLVARWDPSLVLDAAVRQPGEGPGAPRSPRRRVSPS
jgi:hypothetical protein